MAVPIHCSSFNSKTHYLLLSPSKSNLTIKSYKPTTINAELADEPAAAPSKKPTTSSGLGFGSSSSPSSSIKADVDVNTVTKKKQSGRRERATIIRRSPVQKPAFVSQENEAKVTEQSKNESAFLLTWLGLGIVIFVEGISLAISGFLPEEWDKFLVKYLYPVFTPTVVLFVAGTVVYGVLKYLQNQELNNGQK